MACCAPRRNEPTPSPPADAMQIPACTIMSDRPMRLVDVPGGTFMMGDHFDEGYPADGERPVHRVSLPTFNMDASPVTNTEFSRFALATGYVTESEQLGYSAVFHAYLNAPAKEVMGKVEGTDWWLGVRNASWRHPTGSGSHWQDLPDHPVVQVSWNDALAYCHWSGRTLPTEAQWEYAARGLKPGQRYPWGNQLTPDSVHQCNIWQGNFPRENTLQDGYLGTSPVGSFPPNPLGLLDIAGNVWEWCQDWFLPKYYRNSPELNPQGPTIGRGRVMRGGSHLCHESYCNRYRVSARSYNTADSASSNTGFRTVGLPA
ncbi:sulfatase modifying factor 1 (C-alpha-formyglycine- generating enzyme 1) [Arthrobacter sp. MYb224]|nr:sulfatase modifying factor 1 (C-alpha-formyglycine- generating enzyme 1) [Arthrobacter sp. MYb224]PRA04623.1 sulfatase modifying factor 1 (C-alpha-formyglycine- generating enzyme 1) [Arthrobacter sp. MYb229]PRB51465.1 sulfatase modifying factor 1 (C-alpha-formyglycine- generating enzyme 1) [Arthrobacter sp. MYb216]